MKRILVCPVCKSTDVEYDTAGVTGKYRCKNCGFVGSAVLEMTEGEYKEMIEGEEIEKKAEQEIRGKKRKQDQEEKGEKRDFHF
ncbi:TFIIB-type zinc ribbon-containing protein [Archaeoglobus veneficus]|uniref:TFIIB-type domain-containing protein n=1 Tax=Archaeoglobus veneficus (strain DSM 11195 / SNP6) TaxID=693661 RepID=F2KS29_ARCVS|nr:TFIIB-type zinc ribbon-containing protein [Archaeoglobus veneficus]AEA46870.1 hypothetical protein Arcve_0856 [Archaeoglobus veneficus SNP6]